MTESKTTELQKLQQRLNDMGAKISVTLGYTNPTQEELAAEINKALDELEAGKSEEIYDED